jgi:hypothetical protein
METLDEKAKAMTAALSRLASFDEYDVGRVYFVEAVGARRIKIGFTTGRVSARLDSLRAGCPFPLRALGTIETLRRAERFYHGRFRHLRLHGEWFRATGELRSFIRRIDEEDSLPSLTVQGWGKPGGKTTKGKG